MQIISKCSDALPGGFLQTGHLTAPARRSAFGFFRRSAMIRNIMSSVPAPQTDARFRNRSVLHYSKKIVF